MAKYLQTDRRKPDGADLRAQGRKWIERIKSAAMLEKDWMDDAEVAVASYTGEKGASTDGIAAGQTRYDFNILFANVETIVPAIINSPPQPDIRRRFADDDPVAKDVSEVLERAIRVQVDDSKLQVELESAAQDAFLAGRGLVRLRFKADVEGGEQDDDDLHEMAEEVIEDEPGHGDHDASTEGRDEQPGNGGKRSAPASVKNERLTFEAVSWRDYRHGPAKRWEDRPWEAFRHAIPMDDLEAFADNALASVQTLPEDKLVAGDTDNDVVVWEVWEKKNRRVLFIEEDTGKILKMVDDPLSMANFFPICTPMQPIEVTGRLRPVNPFSIYRKLADELDTTTRRISAVTKQMRVRGWYSGDAAELANMLEADDNDFIPIASPEIWAANGGLAGAVAFWPIEKFVQVLRELYANRDATKQAIYEITGISDIVRGASKATETLGAQQIKSQWGSLRIQKMQRMMERAARDLFVMMAEIIPAKFSSKTLEEMTGVQLTPTPQDLTPIPMPPAPPQLPAGQQASPEQQQQAQAAAQQYQAAMQQAQEAEKARLAKLKHIEAVKALLDNGPGQFYRVDVESDSTVRADLTQKKAEQAEFLTGTAAYFQGVAPLIQTGALSKEGALKIYAATARLFTLGKSTEDALDAEIARAEEEAKQPAPAEKPDPAVVKAQIDAKAKEQDMAASAQEHEFRMREMEGQATANAAKAATDKVLADTNIELRRLDILLKKADLAAKGVVETPDGQDVQDRTDVVVTAVMEAVQALAQMVAQHGQAHQAGIETLGRIVSAPNELVRDQAGRPIGSRKVVQ